MSRSAALLAAVCLAGCGLANGVAHTGSVLNNDIVGYCLWCNDEGFPCEVGDDTATCQSVSSFTDCDEVTDPDAGLVFEDSGEFDDIILSPIQVAVSDGVTLRVTLDGDVCPEGFRSRAVDFLIWGASLPSALLDEVVIDDPEALGELVRVATFDVLFVGALAVTPVAVPWPRRGSASLVAVLVCALDEEEGFDSLGIAIADSNPICVIEDDCC